MLLNVDFAPMFLDFGGVEAPEEMQGTSGRKVLSNNVPDDWQTSMYYRYWMNTLGHKVIPNYGVRNERYKLIYYYGVTPEDTGDPSITIEAEWELYDLEQDPREMNNVYGSPDYVKVQATMLAELDRLQAKAEDGARH
jgi:arylsulfatase A-like enzyme